MGLIVYALGFVCVMQSIEEATACYPNSPVNGKWSEWGQWYDDCPHKLLRHRSCTKPKPTNGGMPCRGNNAQFGTCPGWSVWSKWSNCSVPCGDGIKQRHRTCDKPSPPEGMKGCVGKGVDNMTCNNDICPDAVNGEWSDWLSWSKCSTTCGGGIQIRYRKCSDPAPQHGGLTCSGDASQTKNCSDWICPDCLRICPDGGNLEFNCSICICTGTNIDGLVRDAADNHRPLADADIYVVGREWEPYTKSDADGMFTLKNICLSGLELKVKKPGYKAINDTYDVVKGYNVLEMRKLKKPVFIVEPSSKAGFVSQTVSFHCNATSDPPPTHYEWFKDGQPILNDVIDNTNGAVFTLTNLKRSDEGRYACRAVSEGGKVLSRLARLVVKESGKDACDSAPMTLMVTLPPTCHVNDFPVTDVGRCSNEPCVTERKVTDPVKKCCSPVEKQLLNITCKGFTYHLSKVVKCGCAECIEITDVVITVRVKVKSDQSLQDVTVQYGQLTMSVEDDNMLSFVATPHSGRVVFTLMPFDSFMPRLVTLDVADGLSHVYVEVSLVPRPNPKDVDTSKGGEFEVASPGELPSVVGVFIPPNAFIDDSSGPVTGDVTVYVSYADPRNETSLESAPGDFTYEDDEGEMRLLQTFGVVTLVAEDSNGAPVYLQETITLKFNTTALGIAKDDNGKPDALLWVLDELKGQWKRSGVMTNSARSFRRRKRATDAEDMAEGQTLIPRYVPYVNCDRPFLRGRICSIAVFVYFDADFSVPLSGERVSAFMIENGRFIGRTSGYTDATGKACLLVACGLEHIVKLESQEGILIHPSHHLPVGFSVTSRTDGFRFNATPPADREDNLVGPVFRYSRWDSRCYRANSTAYHFKLAKPSIMPSLYTSLNAVEMRPGRALSWFPSKSPEKTMCVLRMQILTSEPSKIQVVGISSASSGQLYGTYTTTLQDGYRACVLVRCPANDSNYTAVDLRIAYKNISKCYMRPSYSFGDSNIRIESTNSSVKVHIRASTGYGTGFSTATGNGDIAFYRVMKQCNEDFSNVAVFSCVDEEGRIEKDMRPV